MEPSSERNGTGTLFQQTLTPGSPRQAPWTSARVIPGGMLPAVLWSLVLWQFFPAGEIPQCVISLSENRHR